MLLEVSEKARVTCHITIVDHECPEGRLFRTESMEFAAKEPQVFHLTDLLPNQRYTILFSGVSVQDAKTKIGRFATVGFSDQKLKIIAISGDNPYDHSRGEQNMWEKVGQTVTEFNDPVQVVLHLGQQVELKPVFDEARVYLSRHANSTYKSHLMDQGWMSLEAKAFEMFRQVYLFQWNLPHVQKVLASASNLMLWNDRDIYPLFTTDSTLAIDRREPTRTMQVARTLLRAARRAFHLYQRQLWDNNVSFLFENERPAVELARKQAEEPVEIGNLDQEMQITRGEEYFVTMGSLGILFLDTLGNRIFPDGSQAPENDLLNHDQWNFISQTLSDCNTNILILATQVPLIDSTCNFPLEQKKILSLVSDWQSSKPNRAILLIAGGIGRGIETRVYDSTFKVNFQQFVTGPITGSVSVAKHLISDKLHDRYEYSHELQPMERSFGLLTVDTESLGIQMQHVGPHLQSVEILVGPIIGKVTDSSAIILLEIDQDAIVSCRVQNVLTRDFYTCEKKFPARKPSVFHFTRLLAGQQYDVFLSGVRVTTQRQGSFKTFETLPQGLNFTLLSRARAIDGDHTELWSILARSNAIPFSDIDATLHLGGQVYPSDNSTCSGQNLDRMRNLYRYHWNLPHVRETLAHGCNIMIWGQPDIGDSDDKNLSRAVFAEYQDQLWKSSRDQTYQSHLWSNFGLFCLDLSENLIGEGQFQALDLFLKQNSLSTVILASPIPFVDDSIDDARIKATCGNFRGFPHDPTTLLRLLNVLIHWTTAQQDSTQRQVVLLSGSDFVGLDTVIQHIESSKRLQQHVIGPISDIVEPFPMEIQGTLADSFTYQHSSIESNNHFGFLSVTLDSVTLKRISNDDLGFLNDRFQIPNWLREIHNQSPSDFELETMDVVQDRLKKLVGNLRESFQHHGTLLNPHEMHRKLDFFYRNLDLSTRELLVRPSLYFVWYLFPFECQDERSYIDLATAVMKETSRIDFRLRFKS